MNNLQKSTVMNIEVTYSHGTEQKTSTLKDFYNQYFLVNHSWNSLSFYSFLPYFVIKVAQLREVSPREAFEIICNDLNDISPEASKKFREITTSFLEMEKLMNEWAEAMKTNEKVIGETETKRLSQ